MKADLEETLEGVRNVYEILVKNKVKKFSFFFLIFLGNSQCDASIRSCIRILRCSQTL
jgi:hypothetical protein